jgi:hypothetical protein
MQITSKDTKFLRNDLPYHRQLYTSLGPTSIQHSQGQNRVPCTLTNNDQMPTGETAAAAEAEVTTLLGKPSIPTTGGLIMDRRMKRRALLGLRPSKAEGRVDTGTQVGTGS